MPPRLKRIMQGSMRLYALFLLPTVLLFLYAGQSDASISRQIGETWQAGFWHLPGLSEIATRISLDILTALLVGLLGWQFFRGWQILVTGSGEQSPAQLKRFVLDWMLLASLILLAVVPFHSSDMYGYLNRGFQQSLYHTNPYLTPVVKIPGWESEPMFHPHWIYNPCPYGFFFAQLTAGITTLCGRHFVAAFLVFKALNVLLLLGITWLILQLGQILGLKRPWLAAYCLGANPLVLLHAVGNGHNDILMAFLLMVACYQLCSPKGARWMAIPLLLLSVLVKYASVLAFPFMALYLWQRDRKALWLGCILSVLLLGVMAYPYIDPHQAWPWADMLDNAGKPQHSLVDLVARAIYYPLKWVHASATVVMELALRALKPLAWLGFVSFYLWRLWRASRQEGACGSLMAETALVLTVMVALVSAKFHPWYTVMFLPFLLLLPEESPWRRFGFLFSLFQLAGFTIFQNLPVISPLVLTVLPLWLAFRKPTLLD